MAKRKGLSRKVRFEVFKRDSFTCQYCGAKAPDVILQVDHVTPVVAGGSNSMANLVTACCDCNLGKHMRSADTDEPDLDEAEREMEHVTRIMPNYGVDSFDAWKVLMTALADRRRARLLVAAVEQEVRDADLGALDVEEEGHGVTH